MGKRSKNPQPRSSYEDRNVLSGFYTVDWTIVHIKSRDMAAVYTLGTEPDRIRQSSWCKHGKDRHYEDEITDITKEIFHEDMVICPDCVASIVRHNINSCPYFAEKALKEIIEIAFNEDKVE